MVIRGDKVNEYEDETKHLCARGKVIECNFILMHLRHTNVESILSPNNIKLQSNPLWFLKVDISKGIQ